MNYKCAVAIAGATRVQAAQNGVTESTHQVGILETKKKGEQNGIPDCN